MNATIIAVLVCLVIILGTIGTFFKRGQAAIADAAASNEPITWGKFLLDSIPDMIASAVLLVPMVISAVSSDYDVKSDLTLVLFNAIMAGAGVPVTASGYLLSIFGAGNKSRKVNRKIIDKKTNIADRK